MSDGNGRKGLHHRISDDPMLDGITKAINIILIGGSVVALLVGWLSVGNSNEQTILQLKEQITDLRATLKDESDAYGKKMDQLTAAIAAMPRSDQLQSVATNIGSENARIDGLDERERRLESQMSAVMVTIDSINEASNAVIGRERKR